MDLLIDKLLLICIQNLNQVDGIWLQQLVFKDRLVIKWFLLIVLMRLSPFGVIVAALVFDGAFFN